MRWFLLATMVALLSATPARAQDEMKPEQLKKMYDDALVQLRAAQDRKNELATENQKLAAEVESLKKQLDAARGETVDLKRQVAENADKSFYLRSCYAAWQSFLKTQPELMGRWKAYLQDGPVQLPQERVPEVMDGNWPLSVEG